jgi:uncharacterized membrane protein YphA (DoxX/SURF4 family)
MLILSGLYRWVGALALGGFTLFATFLANRFWDVPPDERLTIENSFFEHLGLVGGFILVAWHDLQNQGLEAKSREMKLQQDIRAR